MNKKGFTIVEFLLYISVGVIIFLFVGSFVMSILNARAKSQAIAQVEEQGLTVMHLLTQAIRNADVIVAPTAGVSASALQLSFTSSTINPTIFNLINGKITMSEAGGAAIALTASPTIAAALNFQNVSYASTPGAVKINFTLQNNNPGGKAEYNYQKTFYGTASLR